MPENDAGRYAVLNNYAMVGIEDVYTTDCQGGTTSLRYVTRKRINNEHSDRARDTSMPVECMQDFEQIVIGL